MCVCWSRLCYILEICRWLVRSWWSKDSRWSMLCFGSVLNYCLSDEYIKQGSCFLQTFEAVWSYTSRYHCIIFNGFPFSVSCVYLNILCIFCSPLLKCSNVMHCGGHSLLWTSELSSNLCRSNLSFYYSSTPCGLWDCKNCPAPFPGRMSYKATKPSLVSVLYLSMRSTVLLFIRAPFYVLLVLLVFVAMCSVFWLFWLSYQYL